MHLSGLRVFNPDFWSFGMLRLGALESLLCVNQGKVLILVENLHPRDVHMDAGTVLKLFRLRCLLA